jgi:NAD(P)-dependent dehydrogenase (short-subunit alcohol dehydrogenase family)
VGFEGKTAVVTGAASGIGREVCRQLAAAGAHPLLTDLDQAAVDAAAAEIGCEGMVLDVADSAQVQAAVDHVVGKHGRLDLMFNNAGVAIFGEVEEVSLAEWDLTIDVNLRGVAYGTTIAYRQMLSQDRDSDGSRGQIINTASGAGLVPVPLQAHYCTTKHGVIGLSKTLEVEARHRGVGVTTFCPGFVQTGMIENNTMHGSIAGVDAMKLVPVKPITSEKAVGRMLRGVSKRRRLVITPYYARLGWWLERFSLPISQRLHMLSLRELKRRAKPRPKPEA